MAVFANRETVRRWMLGVLPFVILILIYAWASHLRLTENPQDKLLPSLPQMMNAMGALIFEPNARTGDYLFWTDTWSSLRRLGLGVLTAAITALLVGVNMGLNRALRETFGPLLTAASLVPPLSILPILFITLGVEEFAKVSLIFIGVFPLIARDVLLATDQIPREHLIKGVTLGASRLGVAYRIVTPQVFPRLIDTVRLAMGGAWLFLIAAEAIASTEGLGYRIFLVRRYLDMAVILPYVAWITLLGFSADWLLRQWLRRGFAWYVTSRQH